MYNSATFLLNTLYPSKKQKKEMAKSISFFCFESIGLTSGEAWRCVL